MATRLAMTLTNEIHSKLKELATREERSMSFITRVALVDYLEKQGYTINRTHPPQRGGHNRKSRK